MRLVKHLFENRVRAKSRSESCQSAFLRSNPPLVPEDELKELEARDAKASKEARKEGHCHVIVARPSKATRPSILKKPKASKSGQVCKWSKAPKCVCIVAVKPKYRVRCKTNPASLITIPKGHQ